MKGAAYSALGSVFEYLNDDCGYEKWSQYLIEKLKTVPVGSRGADVGCGNGYFTRALSKHGYQMAGIDLSAEMLTKAVELSKKQGVRAEFLSGDITKLKLNFRADFVTAVNDCLNYVPPQKLQSAFTHVRDCLKKGGLFIFDISTPEKLYAAQGFFAHDFERATCLWFNTLVDNRIESEITVFSRSADGRYDRADEWQTLYVHSPEEICNLLRERGFKVVSEPMPGDEKNRINFICEKL